MIDTKIKFDLNTEKAVRKLKVISGGLNEIAKICDDMANSLLEIDTEETDRPIKREPKND